MDYQPNSPHSGMAKMGLRSRSGALWLPSGLLLAIAATGWAAAGGLASCDSTAKFSLPDKKFAAVQVISAFPARVADDGKTITRVCGATVMDNSSGTPTPVAGQNLDSSGQPLTANGFELTMNFVSIGSKRACSTGDDRDQSVAAGELIELNRVASTGVSPTVSPGYFTLNAKCFRERANGTPDCSDNATTLQAAAVNYAKTSPRCHPDDPSSRVYVGILVDHSGSTSGFVDGSYRCVGGANANEACDNAATSDCKGGACTQAPTLLEDSNDQGLHIANDLKEVASDFFGNRVDALSEFVSQLNDQDYALAWYFDEQGLHVVSSDGFKCVGGTATGQKCAGTSDACPGGGSCIGSDDPADDTFAGPTAQPLETAAFGPMDNGHHFKDWLKHGLDSKVRAKGVGRAPIWQAIDNAVTFFTTAYSGALNGKNRHIVLIADGPDTCTESEEYFNYKDLTTTDPSKSTCRTPCASATVKYNELLVRLQTLSAAGQQLAVDIVQFQSQATEYQQPDPRLMEIACRTGGTYQFINTHDFAKDIQQAHSSMLQAMQRVRNSMAGSWRVGFKDSKFTTNTITKGSLWSLQGSLKFQNSLFPSLDTSYQTNSEWNFDWQGQTSEDRRLMLRRSCETDADCNGTDFCSSNHCGDNGLCVSDNRRDRLPCNDDATKRCCGGKCGTDKCDAACKL